MNWQKVDILLTLQHTLLSAAPPAITYPMKSIRCWVYTSLAAIKSKRLLHPRSQHLTKLSSEEERKATPVGQLCFFTIRKLEKALAVLGSVQGFRKGKKFAGEPRKILREFSQITRQSQRTSGTNNGKPARHLGRHCPGPCPHLLCKVFSWKRLLQYQLAKAACGQTQCKHVI